MGDIPLDTNTFANYIFPSFISHKRVRISKLIRKRYFKTRFESSLSYCKFILNSSLNKLATFQLLWDTFIEITPAPVSVCHFLSIGRQLQEKQVEATDVYRWCRRNFVHFDCILPEIQTFCIGTLTFPCRNATSGQVLFTHTMYFLNVLFP